MQLPNALSASAVKLRGDYSAAGADYAGADVVVTRDTRTAAPGAGR